jgi:hypothetical protein
LVQDSLGEALERPAAADGACGVVELLLKELICVRGGERGGCKVRGNVRKEEERAGRERRKREEDEERGE